MSRTEIRYADDGGAYRHHVPTRHRNRVTFGRPDTGHAATAGSLYINVREVRFDGNRIGLIYGTNPSPSNPNRPTAYVWVPDDGERVLHDRLETARQIIERERTAR